MKKRMYTAFTMIGVTVILSVVNYFYLPENVAVQWNSAGEVQRSVSKYLALIIGLCCGVFGGWYWYGKDRSSLVGVAKHLWRMLDFAVGCIGIIVFSVFLMMNL